MFFDAAGIAMCGVPNANAEAIFVVFGTIFDSFLDAGAGAGAGAGADLSAITINCASFGCVKRHFIADGLAQPTA
jgi:hypothetical protein